MKPPLRCFARRPTEVASPSRRSAAHLHRGNGKVSFGWYRVDLTLPERIASVPVTGSTVAFEIVVDDYAEVWADGKLPLGGSAAGTRPLRGSVQSVTRAHPAARDVRLVRERGERAFALPRRAAPLRGGDRVVVPRLGEAPRRLAAPRTRASRHARRGAEARRERQPLRCGCSRSARACCCRSSSAEAGSAGPARSPPGRHRSYW